MRMMWVGDAGRPQPASSALIAVSAASQDEAQNKHEGVSERVFAAINTLRIELYRSALDGLPYTEFAHEDVVRASFPAKRRNS